MPQDVLFDLPPGAADPEDTTPLRAAVDGSCLRNPGPGGWAWVMPDGRWAAGGATRTTNNIQELTAVHELLLATAHVAHRDLLIEADSRYVIDACSKWVHGWKRRGWKTADGSPVKNAELIQSIDRLLTDRAVTWKWVKGHAGHALNEEADRRARAAAIAMRDSQPVSEGPGFRH